LQVLPGVFKGQARLGTSRRKFLATHRQTREPGDAGFMLNRMSREACPRAEDTAFAASPLLASAVRENVRIVGGRLLIPLLPRWPVLIRGLRTFGPVISFCGNPGAGLGTPSRYPEVWSTPAVAMPAEATSSFSFH